jgi:hypothetical protein
MSLVMTVNGWQSYRLAKAKLSELQPPEPASAAQWSADSKAVFARAVERGYKKFQLHRVDADTGVATLLTEDRSDTYLDYWSHFWSGSWFD